MSDGNAVLELCKHFRSKNNAANQIKSFCKATVCRRELERKEEREGWFVATAGG